MKFLNIDHNLHQSHMRARCLEETWPTTPVPPRPPRRGPPWPAAPFSGHHRHYASHEHHPHRNNSHDLYFLFRVHFPPTNITITPALQTVKEKYRPRSFHCSAQVFIIIIVMIIIIIIMIIIIVIIIIVFIFIFIMIIIIITRSYAALRAADLDWIVGPGYSPGR